MYNNLYSPAAPMSFGGSFTMGENSIEVSDVVFTDDWRLAAGSPAIDAGSEKAEQEWTDYDGNPVPCGSVPDIGATEFCE